MLPYSAIDGILLQKSDGEAPGYKHSLNEKVSSSHLNTVNVNYTVDQLFYFANACNTTVAVFERVREVQVPEEVVAVDDQEAGEDRVEEETSELLII